MGRAIEKFEAYHNADMSRPETKWHEKKEEKKDWSAFKKYWKEEIHKLNTTLTTKKRTNQATIKKQEPCTIEAQSLCEAHTALLEQIQFQHALHTNSSTSPSNSTPDDLSTITDYFAGMEQHMTNQIRRSSAKPSSATSITSTTTSDKLQTAKARNPKGYQHMNDRKGKEFQLYC